MIGLAVPAGVSLPAVVAVQDLREHCGECSDPDYVADRLEMIAMLHRCILRPAAFVWVLDLFGGVV